MGAAGTRSFGVRLFRRAGPGGERRIALHFGGDAMLGRRYIEPSSELTARVTPGDGGASARAVVAALAPLFRAADLRSLNLETVVGDFPAAAAYPRKRFLLLSPPETASLLDELAANTITLGNNHARDWLDAGVASTVAILEEAELPHTGAGTTAAAAAEPLIVDIAGMRIGVLSYTSVNGDFVNDSLPDDSSPTRSASTGSSTAPPRPSRRFPAPPPGSAASRSASRSGAGPACSCVRWRASP